VSETSASIGRKPLGFACTFFPNEAGSTIPGAGKASCLTTLGDEDVGANPPNPLLLFDELVGEPLAGGDDFTPFVGSTSNAFGSTSFGGGGVPLGDPENRKSKTLLSTVQHIRTRLLAVQTVVHLVHFYVHF
jgi:hypothetical protein